MNCRVKPGNDGCAFCQCKSYTAPPKPKGDEFLSISPFAIQLAILCAGHGENTMTPMAIARPMRDALIAGL
jgi:hypothetical protein